MKEKELLAAKKAIGDYKTEILLRDATWGEPIIRAAVACMKKEEYFSLGVNYDNFDVESSASQALLNRAAEQGVYDLVVLDKNTGQLAVLIHWYMPLPDIDEERDPDYRGEVIAIDIRPGDTIYDPVEDPTEVARSQGLLTDFLGQINCVPQPADLLETLRVGEEANSTLEVYLWRR